MNRNEWRRLHFLLALHVPFSAFGADLECVCQRAGLLALQAGQPSVTARDFEVALAGIEPSVSHAEVEHFLAWGRSKMHAK